MEISCRFFFVLLVLSLSLFHKFLIRLRMGTPPTTAMEEPSRRQSVDADQDERPSSNDTVTVRSVTTTTNEKTQISDNYAAEKKAARKRRIAVVLTFLSLQLSLFLAALDNTIVATSLPKIGSDFEAMAISSWVVNSYVLTLDAFQPLFSKFSDIFGRKYILMFGIVVFLIGSVLCGASQTMIMLIVCRAIQGIGAASIFSMVFVIISDLVPLEKRGSYQGIVNAVFALSSVFGPLIGGSLTDNASWRWNFYINLPIGGVALVILFFFLHLPMEKQDLKAKLKRIDYAGNFLVLAAATLFLLAMNFGGQTFPWDSAAVIAPFVLTGVLIALLVVVEVKYAAEPLMPPRLFKNRSIVAILSVNLFFGLTFFAALYYLPIYFQVVRGDSATWSGIRLIPMQMVIAVLSTGAGLFISKIGMYRPLITIGMGFLTLCIGLFSLYDVDTSWSMIYGFTVIGGAGMGLLFSSTIIAIQAAAEPRDIAVVTGLNNFSRVLGGALGVAIASAILNSSLKKDLPNAIPMQYVEMIFQSPEYIRDGLPQEYFQTTVEIYVESLRFVWHILTIMSGLGFLSSLLVKHYPLRRPGGRPAPKKQDEQEKQQVEVGEVNGRGEKQVALRDITFQAGDVTVVGESSSNDQVVVKVEDEGDASNSPAVAAAAATKRDQ
ncbi:major facilitator superfamily domain-containing protein [Zychaea mexicana]|uniref:major facilitator superfamily domain-containing protein n=1 Tax=Zychaea mexicana TaxID=64656 RepID=UPI0022FE828C|nr:major facilitator superfamily domain-containing protein [Zychaea mexicana]KAI9495948.1 major facilitator superfamily domain-containing protein [Zychaea mexicana]